MYLFGGAVVHALCSQHQIKSDLPFAHTPTPLPQVAARGLLDAHHRPVTLVSGSFEQMVAFVAPHHVAFSTSQTIGGLWLHSIFFWGGVPDEAWVCAFILFNPFYGHIPVNGLGG